MMPESRFAQSESEYMRALIRRRAFHIFKGHQSRCASRTTLDAGQDDVNDILGRNIAASVKGVQPSSNALLTTQKEALHLYRDVLRASRLFVWKDERGVSWRDVIRDSARKEFDAKSQEKNPETVTQMLLTGRQSLDDALQKFMAKREKIIQEEHSGAGNQARRQ